jgi:hypothetical protein
MSGREPRGAHPYQIENECSVSSSLHSACSIGARTAADDLFAHGLRTYIKAGFAADLPDALPDALLDRAALLESPISQVELLALGGAISQVSPEATAFPFRNARWLINIPAIRPHHRTPPAGQGHLRPREHLPPQPEHQAT